MQPKKQLKVQYIGIFEKKTLFIDQKCIRAMPERKRFFAIDVFPNQYDERLCNTKNHSKD